VGQQAQVLSVADAYRALGVLAILLIPLALRLTRIPAPSSTTTSTHE
jgi:DHA2 family multidrug resistance protein